MKWYLPEVVILGCVLCLRVEIVVDVDVVAFEDVGAQHGMRLP